MINFFIGSIIAIFFIGKASKEVEEKTENASWIRTLVYAVLSFVICTFYVKTNQVATIYTMVDVTGIRESRDTAGNVADTLSLLEIKNTFNSPLIDGNKANAVKNKALGKRLNYGGVYCKLTAQNLSPYKIVTNHANLDSLGLSLLSENHGHNYMIDISNTSIPSLIPIYPSYRDQMEYGENKMYMAMFVDDMKHMEFDRLEVWENTAEGESEHVETELNPFNVGSFCSIIVRDSLKIDEVSEPLTFFKFQATGTMINTLNFFTAADISQYTHALQIHSTCPIKEINFMYDIPIEIPIINSSMKVGPMGFGFKGDFVNDVMRNNSTVYHVKLPTLANLQLIRSLILTTLATALLAMFFTNMYYYLRKRVLKYYTEKQIAVNENGLKKFKLRTIILLLALLLLIIYLTQLVISGNPIVLPIEIADCMDFIVLGFILILMVIVFLLYIKFRPLYSQKKKK